MDQGTKNKTVLPEITLVIGRSSTKCISFSILLFDTNYLARYIVFIASSEIPEREGSISPSSFHWQLSTISHMLVLST